MRAAATLVANLVADWDEQEASRVERIALPQSREAVAQTPGEAAGSLLRAGYEIGHLVRREGPVRRNVVPHGGSGMQLRERAARFLRQLCATASRESANRRGPAQSSGSS